ncbi:MetQ/NlpA family ABC transporter substrate-binding protein [Anaerococcus sp.]|uniref:MetQ/NlpA family ABC transporter substrate-binding protein n=1 Tax=Anaerococcus sp. TaxID=1872515 RepID=UPI002590396C|nr:MetQ/NlpA family ABC transporter substrate-binding protein [Anaerococcus sp.]MDU3212230.1 MetQ/NlpA family ABC transporter substrate-binding protein [Anaerococcus sp.]
MKRISKIGLGLALILGLSSCGANNNETKQPAENNAKTEEATSTDPLEGKDVIKVGVCGEHNEVWDDIIERYNAGNDRKLELVKFSEYREPNEALIAGDIDLNAFQHKKFLKEFNEESGSDVVSIGDTMIAPLGIYSSKITDIKDLKYGARVAIPDDPSNSARSLFLLQTAGLIKVNGEDGDNITTDDITENPQNLEIITLGSSQTARSLDDVDIACVNSGIAVDADLIPSEDALFLEDPKDPDKQIYVNVIATTQANKDSAILKDLVDNYYHTDQTKKIVDESSKGSEFPAW